MIARAVVNTVADDKKLQILQVDVLADETKDDVERFQNFGFTSVPKAGAEAIVVFVGGTRDHGVVLAVDDRQYRLRSLESGEVAMYDATGSKIVMKKNGDIEVIPSSGKVKLTGDLAVSGDVNCDGTVTGTTDCVGGGKSLKSHTHVMDAAHSPIATVSGGAGTISGTSGAPS